MNYTKGEWRVDKRFIYDESGRTIAELVDGGFEELEANAHLIAAAPLLYEACRAANIDMKMFGKFSLGTQKRLDQAIAKAEGK